MKLTVDASIVVKWFVAEPLCHEARLALARRIELHAPDLVLSEFANTIWKKARRNEILEQELYLNELPYLTKIISLLPDRELVERAAQIAFAIDHPIYDCLYLACAELTGSEMITADKHLANKLTASPLGIRIQYLGDLGTTTQLEAAAFASVLEHDKIEKLADAFQYFEKTEQFVVDSLFAEKEGLRILSSKDQEQYLNSPAYIRLISLIKELDEEERIDLLALGWLGAGLFPSWRLSIEHAEQIVLANEFNARYAAGYGRHWQSGFEIISLG